MKYGKYCLWVSLIVLAYMVGRLQEQKSSIKAYQTACVLNDCCRNMVDNIGVDAEEIYGEYVDNLDCDPKLVITRDDVLSYTWGYSKDWEDYR